MGVWANEIIIITIYRVLAVRQATLLGTLYTPAHSILTTAPARRVFNPLSTEEAAQRV